METTGEGRVEDPLRSAAAVAILVHGVGDHSQVDILDAAKEAFRTVGGWHSTIVQLPGLVSTDQLTALRLDASDQSYFILPFIWSRSRQRLVQATESVSLPLDFLWRGATGFGSLVVDLLRSGVQASSWRRIAVLLFALCFSAVSFGLLAAYAWVVYWHVMYVSQWWFNPGPSLLLLGVLFLIPIAVGLLWRLIIEVFDFIADVAAYVARPDHREAQLSAVRLILAQVAVRARSANLIVVGHSLGSVVVSHSLLDPRPEVEGGKRVLLVTLGSPLRNLAVWFASVIRSPEQLYRTYEATGSPHLWVNFWRDGDHIGRAIELKGQAFAEATLGEGGHTNYWRDQRLWRRLADLLKVRGGEDIRSVATNWQPDRDWQALETERQRGITHHVLVQKASSVLFVCILGTALSALTKYRQALLATGRAVTLGAVWVCALLLWLALVWVNAKLKPNEEALSDYAIKRHGSTKVWTLLLASGVACLWGLALALFYWASRGER